jgi:flagellar basal-body rod protein FlgB
MRTEFDTFLMLQHALDAANLRQRVYANNIANIDTPGYKREDVQFESVLSRYLAEAVDQPLSSPSGTADLAWQRAAAVEPAVVVDPAGTQIENNGNNVDVDAEMARLAENQIRYNALIQEVQTRLSRWRTAINGE